MPDRYDPKLSVRPLSERKPSDTRRGAEDDPLVELARLVSGRGTLETQPMPKGKPTPASAAEPPKVASVDFGRNLEDELLSDLQASFTTIHAPPPPPPPPALSAARPMQAAPASMPAWSERPSPPPAAAPTQPAPAMRSTVAERSAAPIVPPQEQRAAPRGPVADRTEVTSAPLRPVATAGPAPAATQPAEVAAVKPAPSRWEKPPEPPKPPPPDLSRFAPQKPTAPPPAAPDVLDEFDEDIFAENLPFTEQPAATEEEFQLEGFDMVPGYGDEDQLPPYPEDELSTATRRRPSRGLIVVAGILAVALVGSLAMIIFRSGDADGSVPPIITADTTPTKIAPEDTGGADATDAQGKLIYDRVDSGAEATDSELLTPSDDPLADIESAGQVDDNPISRVIIPGGPGIDGPVDGNAAATEPVDGSAAAAADALAAGDSAEAVGASGEPIGPRKVRTVIVRPDGTIVSSGAADEGAAPAAAAATDADATAPAPLPTPQDDTAAVAGAGGTGAEELDITPLPEAGSTDIASAESGDEPLPLAEPEAPAPEAEVKPPPTPAAKPAPKPAQKTIVATGGSKGPIDLTPGTSAGKAPASSQIASAGGATLVQVSSQRSEDAARTTFRDLQARFPSVLASYQPNIQRVDLGAKGVYYRVRVGPFAGSDAQRVCEALKSAGGDCILAQR